MVGDPQRIDASPTKGFFIEMLVRDIELPRAVADLVDNCIDGARNLRPNEVYQGLYVHIEADKNHLRVIDNCGGIEVERARKYAFRFGRPPDMPATHHTIGQFGVGMKRALFKMGRHFRIESRTETTRFVVDVSVEAWEQSPQWSFRFSDLAENLTKVPPSKRGTTVEATNLHDRVKEEFGLENFRTSLMRQLERANQYPLHRGLEMKLNGKLLKAELSNLIKTRKLHPAYRTMAFDDSGAARVDVRIYAGIADSNPDRAGWYVFCNGRMVLDADKTRTTGWGQAGRSGIPQYHNQFARFRGYVLFDSDDAGRLPWNTTKSGLDLDSPVYQNARLQMVGVMRPVIDFLNRLDREKDLPEKFLTPLVTTAHAVLLEEIPENDTFAFPEPPPAEAGPAMGRISFQRPQDDIDRVKESLNVDSNREVGEGTFDYYVDAEI